MATNQVYDDGRKLDVTASHPATPSSGDPVRVGEVTGVALTDERSDGKTSVDFGPAVYDLSVKGINDDGNSAVAVGDALYYVDADTPPLSKKVSGRFVGYALETVGSGSTTTIEVLLLPGTQEGEFRKILADTSNYIYADKANNKIVVRGSQAGGDSPKLFDIALEALTGTAGYRQGVIALSVNRADGQVFTTGWDGNPDCAIKIGATNRANNLDGADEIGGLRGLDLSARNRGTNLAWVNAAHFGARNDSGKTVDEVKGIGIRAENYGTVNDDIIGLDVNMSVESLLGSPNRTPILVRNTDQSGMAAVPEVIKVSHTSTNGFTNLINFAGATGDVIASGSLKDSAAADILCDARIPVVWNGVTYYIPAYDTVV